MNKAFKTMMSIILIVSFLAMTAICCCVIKDFQKTFTKTSCSHCKTSSKTVPAGQACCLTKLFPMEVASSLYLLLPMVVFLGFLASGLFYYQPRRRLSLGSIYLHGPPNPRAIIPLYLQSRSLRI